MSRSRKKYPIGGHAIARSEKWWKRNCHHAWRARTRRLLVTGMWDLARTDDRSIHAADNWTWPKDGKRWFDSPGAGDDYRRDWQRIRNRRKYVVARVNRYYRSLHQYYWSTRRDWDFDRSMRK